MKYKAVIGLEMHVEVKSNRKVFSLSKNEYTDIPNIYVDEIDLAHPGVLPVLNKECVIKALKMALALNCNVTNDFYFERKNYYYPDLPKGYQITQETKPIPVGCFGKVNYLHDNEVKCASINNIHLEEDSAKLTHALDKTYINYNRCGVPLLEVVTEPSFTSADEAVAFLETMKNIYKYLDISEADQSKGQIRCDVNISIMDYDKEFKPENFGTRVEVKNVNSFSAVYDAINYEIDRQTKMKETGEYDSLIQETRRWDETTKTTLFMRDKKNAIDYKYFVEPNIPKVRISDELISKIKEDIPKLSVDRYITYVNEYKLSSVNANKLIKDKNISDYFDSCINIGIDPYKACIYICENIVSYLNDKNINISNISVTPEKLKIIIDSVNNNEISSKIAKEILFKALDENIDIKEYINNNKQVSSEDDLNNIIDNILNNNEDNVKAYKDGKTNLFQFFVGQVMKETRGKANPELVRDLLNSKLN